jgi:hypothetical protein
MNTTFRLDPCYELEITSDGTTHSKDGLSGGCSRGSIGVMVHYTPLVLAGDPQLVATTPIQITLRPNQVRAIASAMLSAVSEARA